MKFKVYTRACDGTHLLGTYNTLDKAKQKVEEFCQCTIDGNVLKADWIGNYTAISAFGDRLSIEES